MPTLQELNVKNVFIYARVSTHDQWDHGLSIPDQKDKCGDYATENGLRVLEILEEDESGTIAPRNRRQASKLYERAHEMDAILVWTTDRISREDPKKYDHLPESIRKEMVCPKDFLDFVMDFLEMGKYVYIVKMNRITTAGIVDYVEGMQAGQELRDIRDRTHGGRIAKAKKLEKWPGTSQVPFGYKKVGLGRDEKTLDVDWGGTAETVLDIFRWYVVDRMTLKAIARKLDDLGIPTPKKNTRKKYRGTARKQGNLWHHTQVSRILSFEGYLGTFYYAGIVRPVPRLAFVDRELWQAANNRRKTRQERRLGNNSKSQYLLSSIFMCCCSAAMTGDRYKVKTGYTRFYKCGHRGRKDKNCPHGYRTLNAERLEAMVWDYVCSLVLNPETTAEKALDAENQMLEQLAPTIKRLEQQKRRLVNLETELAKLTDSLAAAKNQTAIDAIVFAMDAKGAMIEAHKLEIAKLETEVAESGITDGLFSGVTAHMGFRGGNTFTIGTPDRAAEFYGRTQKMAKRIRQLAMPVLTAKTHEQKREWLERFTVNVFLELNKDATRDIRITCKIGDEITMGFDEIAIGFEAHSSNPTCVKPYILSIVLPYDTRPAAY